MASTIWSTTQEANTVAGKSNYWTFKVVSTEGDYNVTDNTSPVSTNIQLKPKYSSLGGYALSSTIEVFVNGTSVGSKTITELNRSQSSTSYIDLGTISKDISHDSDGSKSVVIKVVWTPAPAKDTWLPKSTTITSGTINLTTIPRKTSAVGFTGTVEKSTSLSISPASTSFTHSFKLTFGSNVKYLTSSGSLSTTEQKLSGSSFTFNVPSEYYTQFTGSSATGTLTLITYSGTTSLGSSTASFTIYADGTLCLPYLTGTLKDTNSTTANLTAGSTTSNKIVKGYSTATATLSNVRASSANDSKATITSLIINGESQSTSTRSYSKTGYASSTMSVYVKNSRGFEKTFTLTATGGLLEYSKPTLTATFKRTTETGSTVTATYNGTFFNSSFGSVSNALTLKWAYKLSSATSYTTGGTLTPTISGNNFSGTISCGSFYTYTNSYDFIIYYNDKIVSDSFKQNNLVSKPLFAIGNDGNLEWHGSVNWDGINIKPVEVS